MNQVPSIKLMISAKNWIGVFTNEVRKEFSKVNFVECKKREEILEHIKDADVALIGPWDSEIFSSAQRLKWVHTGTGGVESYLFPEFTNSNVIFTCGKSTYNISGAESALASILLFSKQFHLKRNIEPKDGNYFSGLGDQYPPENIMGQTLGIIGTGNMGQALAERASNLGLKVLGTSRYKRTDTPIGVDKMFDKDDISELLSTSDFIVIAVPNTKETQGIVNKSLLSQMKKTSYLIDISGRLTVFNYPDLQQAIEENWIAGVSLQPSGHDPDLEMPPINSDFWKRDNVIVTTCRVTPNDASKMFLDNLMEFQKGTPMEGIVNKKIGY